MEKKVFRGIDTLFYNSQCLVVEYHDLIAMPWFTMLLFTQGTEAFKKVFDMSEISEYDISGLLEWYIFRKHRNIFKNLPSILDRDITDEEYDKILSSSMKISENLYNIPVTLKFLSILRILLSEPGVVKQVIIYNETEEPMIEKSLNKYFSNLGTKVKYMHGKFNDLLTLVPSDSTYVFSDITKVNNLVELNRLNLSCILIANGLRYNYMENDQTKLKVDLDELLKTHLFKYSFFDNFDLENALSSDVMPNEINGLTSMLNGEKIPIEE